jgi:hypothetical protein
VFELELTEVEEFVRACGIFRALARGRARRYRERAVPPYSGPQGAKLYHGHCFCSLPRGMPAIQTTAPDLRELTRRIRAEYLEMPGLRLTERQARRIWNLDASRCLKEVEQTEVGSYFVANYPPFSVWTPEAVGTDGAAALAAAPAAVPLGLYLHIPFCRKRCHFCYFRVYVNKSAREVEQYLDVLAREWELYQQAPAIAGRPLDFVYFGGGTPSFLSTSQLQGLVSRLTAITPWTSAEEITFECEPGTLSEAKLDAIRRWA